MKRRVQFQWTCIYHISRPCFMKLYYITFVQKLKRWPSVDAASWRLNYKGNPLACYSLHSRTGSRCTRQCYSVYHVFFITKLKQCNLYSFGTKVNMKGLMVWKLCMGKIKERDTKTYLSKMQVIVGVSWFLMNNSWGTWSPIWWFLHCGIDQSWLL